MWATQPVLTAALNKEFRTKKPSDSDKGLYPQIVVCPIPNPEPVRALPDQQTDHRSVPCSTALGPKSGCQGTAEDYSQRDQTPAPLHAMLLPAKIQLPPIS